MSPIIFILFTIIWYNVNDVLSAIECHYSIEIVGFSNEMISIQLPFNHLNFIKINKYYYPLSQLDCIFIFIMNQLYMTINYIEDYDKTSSIDPLKKKKQKMKFFDCGKTRKW